MGVLAFAMTAFSADDILLADFEGADYGAWEVTGAAFGTGPAHGTLGGQQHVSGFLGQGLVNSFLGGDGPIGTLTSPEFTVSRRYINFLIGGGHHPGETAVQLVIDDDVKLSTTGNATTPADDEHLSWMTWDVTAYYGKKARVRIIDTHAGDWGHLNVDQIVLSDVRAMPLRMNESLTRADSSVRGAVPRVAGDPLLPLYHPRPPALWCNDPNGPLYYKGHYHLFYQHNPYGDRWEHMHWGHVSSRDLVHWVFEPIALWPSLEIGEKHCFSGCAFVDGNGHPMLFYTSIGGRDPEHWAAIAADEDLVDWKKLSEPIATLAIHGATEVRGWRDPYVFAHAGETWMVIGGNVDYDGDARGAVQLYRATNAELTDWEYRGVVFYHPDTEVGNIECPNFFPLGDKFVLLISPHRRPEYFIGDFDAEAGTFTCEHRGLADYGPD